MKKLKKNQMAIIYAGTIKFKESFKNKNKGVAYYKYLTNIFSKIMYCYYLQAHSA